VPDARTGFNTAAKVTHAWQAIEMNDQGRDEILAGPSQQKNMRVGGAAFLV
jgi:hypothetical protein